MHEVVFLAQKYVKNITNGRVNKCADFAILGHISGVPIACIMARTSRNVTSTANMDALDNIDLDDMFADDGDALFDGLDIDLDMDDITGGGDLDSQPAASSMRALAPQGFPTRAVAPEEQDSSRSRRKTKRKAKMPAFFEDADDDYYDDAPAKKKKKATKATVAAKKKEAAKATQEDSLTIKPQPPSLVVKGKGTSNATAMLPPLPLARGWSTSGSYVAAAGQFGGRNKRGASFTLPKASSKQKLPMARSVSESKTNKSRASSLPTASASVAAAASAAAASQAIPAPHAAVPQSTYCGIHPSNTLFYPFMPSLPLEPSIKSRKVYSAIDRINSSFTSHLHSPTITTASVAPAKESEPIFQLMQESLKEEKPSATQHQAYAHRSESVGFAIGALRRTISVFDKSRMAGDWFAVCALLQRQHDFLKQNAENMERWCKDNLPSEDYASVYEPNSVKGRGTDGPTVSSVLGSFTTRELKVKILCIGFKEPKTSGPLRATLPHRSLPDASPDKTARPISKPKKRKLPVATMAQDTKDADAASQAKTKQSPPPLSYMNMKPVRRRRNVAEMLNRTARELESACLSRLDVRRKAIDRHESDLQKIADQNSFAGIHTMGMWKWLEASGYFGKVTETEINQFLEDTWSQEAAVATSAIQTHRDQKRAALILGEGINDDAPDESVFDRLQSLLVEEGAGEKGDNDEEDVVGMDFNELFTVTETADVSQLTLDERAYIQLRSFGLADKLNEPVTKPTISSDHMAAVRNGVEVCLSNVTSKNDDASLYQNGHKNNAQPKEVQGDLDDVIDAMKTELVQVDEQNSRRAAFLESVSRFSRRTAENRKQTTEQEASLISKCQQLLRKSKELKAKSGVASKKDDNLALPW